jgi:hypothetical protein
VVQSRQGISFSRRTCRAPARDAGKANSYQQLRANDPEGRKAISYQHFYGLLCERKDMTQNNAQTIKSPEANPIVAVLLTWFVFHLGHFVVNKQQRKWLFTLIATIIGSVLCCLPGVVIGILSIVDSYQTATRLKNGEEIGVNEYSNGLLFQIIKLVDKEATFKS